MSRKKLYINTIGCQMNIYDSDQIERVLNGKGFTTVSSPEQADLVILNTCAIREKAEQKVYSFLGRMAGLKRKKPDLIVGVGGCVAQQEGKNLFKRAPYLDFVFGTGTIGRLPDIVAKIECSGCHIVDVEMPRRIKEIPVVPDKCFAKKVTGFVTIMKGCDNFCSYCVVPYVRGREFSRPSEKILDEISCLVQCGMREVTLLGQNVNSYGKKENLCSFSELLSRVNEIKGLYRIRFTTSHPKDLSEDLILSFKNLNKLCDHIHLPVQSGSDRILQKMKRKYTRADYIEKIDKLRKACPSIAITTDIIVGFPGETASDFKQTLDLIKTMEYDGLFAFKYSDRPNVLAARLPEKVSEREKKERLQKILDLQNHYTIRKNKALEGSTMTVLVEGLSRKQKGIHKRQSDADIQWTGRTTTNKIVNFNTGVDNDLYDRIMPGSMIDVYIEKGCAHSLTGKPVKIHHKRRTMLCCTG